jgi:hypothetical protein
MIARHALVVSLVALLIITGQAWANMVPDHELWSIQQPNWTPGFEPFRWAKMSSGELMMWYGKRPMEAAPSGEWTIYTYSDPDRGEMAAVKCRELPGRKIDIEWARAVRLKNVPQSA